MAILCLASDLMDLKERLSRMIVAYTYDRQPVTVADLEVQGAMTLLLKDAIKPNLVQTLENGPAFVHGGPFANIAHGTNTLIATKMGLKLSDYFITEAGFGADLGAEKFFNIVSRYGDLHPDLTVIVATARALKLHGGANKKELANEDLAALEKGFANLAKHVENVAKFKVPAVVAINRFPTDTPAELQLIADKCRELGVPVALADVFAKGGEGGIELAETVLQVLETQPSHYTPLYPLDLSIKKKIEIVAQEIYGADGVEFTSEARRDMRNFTRLGLDKLPVCMAKTQYSLSDNPKLLGRPEGFTITVREIRASVGAGFLVAITGDIMTMPGLPKRPAAQDIDIDADGRVTGLF